MQQSTDSISTENMVPDPDTKYMSSYIPDSEYWGLGIENETYFVLDNFVKKNGAYLKKNRRRERYSIDYNNNFDQDTLVSTLDKLFVDGSMYKIPTYVNAHTFLKTDVKGEHRTLYTYGIKYNPKFDGTSLHEHMQKDDWYATRYENNYVYDGDTCEFITQNFYNVTVDQCVNELIDTKKNWLDKTNEFMASISGDLTTTNTANSLPRLNFPLINYGIVQFRTNPYHVNMFNNGTYHINITLPTKLDSNNNIADPEKFRLDHSKAIKIIQWFEPLMVACYGSPDILAIGDPKSYSAGSLRLTASRYTGMGTYNSNEMPKGKLLQELKLNVDSVCAISSWYNKIYQQTKYISGDHIGYDFNYAKHYNAGIEFRILDWFPEKCLKDFVNIMILMIAHGLEINIDVIASDSDIWNDWVSLVLKNGWSSVPDDKVQQMYSSYLKLPIYDQSASVNSPTYFSFIVGWLYDKYSTTDLCKKVCGDMVRPYVYNVNAYMWENNYLNYISTDSVDSLTQQLYNTYIAKDNNNILLAMIDRIKDSLATDINNIGEFHKNITQINIIPVEKYMVEFI